MSVSPKCSRYYTVTAGVEIIQGRGRCPECRITDKDMKVR